MSETTRAEVFRAMIVGLEDVETHDCVAQSEAYPNRADAEAEVSADLEFGVAK